MNTLTLDTLNQKLKNAPDFILERVLGYADALLDAKKSFTLSDKQKEILLSQENLRDEDCTDAYQVYDDLKRKHGL